MLLVPKYSGDPSSVPKLMDVWYARVKEKGFDQSFLRYIDFNNMERVTLFDPARRLETCPPSYELVMTRAYLYNLAHKLEQVGTKNFPPINSLRAQNGLPPLSDAEMGQVLTELVTLAKELISVADAHLHRDKPYSSDVKQLNNVWAMNLYVPVNPRGKSILLVRMSPSEDASKKNYGGYLDGEEWVSGLVQTALVEHKQPLHTDIYLSVDEKDKNLNLGKWMRYFRGSDKWIKHEPQNVRTMPLGTLSDTYDKDGMFFARHVTQKLTRAKKRTADIEYYPRILREFITMACADAITEGQILAFAKFAAEYEIPAEMNTAPFSLELCKAVCPLLITIFKFREFCTMLASREMVTLLRASLHREFVRATEGVPNLAIALLRTKNLESGVELTSASEDKRHEFNALVEELRETLIGAEMLITAAMYAAKLVTTASAPFSIIVLNHAIVGEILQPAMNFVHSLQGPGISVNANMTDESSGHFPYSEFRTKLNTQVHALRSPLQQRDRTTFELPTGVRVLFGL